MEILAKAYLANGRGAVVAEQAFIMYSIAVRAMAAPLRSVPQKDHHHDLPGMAEAVTTGPLSSISAIQTTRPGHTSTVPPLMPISSASRTRC